MAPSGDRSNLKPVGQKSDSTPLPNSLLADLESIATSIAVKNGFDLCDVQILSHVMPMTMQIQIRLEEGGDVSLDDCARFSKPMEEALEASQLFQDNYVLEISSPGVGVDLLSDRDFGSFRGFPVEVCHKKGNDSEILQSGLLLERSSEHVHLNVKGRINRIPRQDVIRVRLTQAKGS